jgi:phosphoserine phosphatase
MRHVLSLIAAKPKALTEADIASAERALGRTGAGFEGWTWLAEGEAAETGFDGAAADVLAAARETFAGRAMDVNVLPADNRRKKLLVADMDSTMIGQECIDELAAEIGLRSRVAAITESAMRGEIAFEPALRERVALFKGLPLETVRKVLAGRIAVMPGAATLVATMRTAGAHTLLVTGGFSIFAEPVARAIGFDGWRANTLASAAGKLTGRVEEPILGRSAKEDALVETAARLRLALSDTVAVGDGANDLGMIRRAGLGVAFRGKPALRAAADAALDHSDLTGLLFLQGYRRDGFVAAEPVAIAVY